MFPKSPKPVLTSTDMDFVFDNPASNTQEAEEVHQQTVVVLGPGGVGKTSLTIKLITNNFIDYYDPTIEDCYRVVQDVDGKRTYLDIIDTAGQQEYSGMQDSWILENEAFVLVYAVDNFSTFEEVQHLKAKIEMMTGDDDKKREMVLVGNKCDVQAQERQVSVEDGERLAKLWGCRFMEASAKEYQNVAECFHEAVRAISKAKAQSPPVRKPRQKQCCVMM